jgi:hypothetical protein
VSSILYAFRRIPNPPAVALPLALLAVATLVVRPASQAADLHQWAAGERAMVTSAPDADLAAAIDVRVAGLERALGLSGTAGRRFAVVDDRFQQRRVDEVTYLDQRGRPIGLVRLTPDGRLVAAVRLGYRDAFALGQLDAAAAVSRARSLTASLGVAPPPTSPSVRPMMNGTLWAVSWPRVVAGVAVIGDGLTVRLWRSGDLHSVTVGERPLEQPQGTISAERARAALEDLLPGIVSAERRSDGVVGAPVLRWVAANDRFRPSGADAPASSLRLAYVFEMRFAGVSATLIRSVTFWIDAETAELIGGDLLQ